MNYGFMHTASRMADIPVTTAWQLAAVMEMRGREGIWQLKRPDVLTALRQQAIIESVESSNRLEGVEVPRARLTSLVSGITPPQERPEEELWGYRRALDWIFAQGSSQPVTPRLALKLHALAAGGAGDAGKWKSKDNEIIELLPNGERKIRFVPVSAKQTPQAMKALCADYTFAVGQSAMPPPLAIALYIFEFLCIHPFRDGNGRVSRLLTTCLLQGCGFGLCRYISLERMIEETKEEYYAVLERCSAGWADGRNEIVPWLNYLLGIIRRGYEELGHRIEAEADAGAKTGLVHQAVQIQTGAFALADIAAACPTVSMGHIKKVLSALKNAGQLEQTGRGRGAKWRHRL